MARFEKGKSGNPAGRPVGSKNYTNVSIWLERIWEVMQGLPESEQLEHSWRAVNALLPKIPMLPASPGDSAANAANAFGLMNGLAPLPEPPQTPPNAPHTNGNGTGNGSNGAI